LNEACAERLHELGGQLVLYHARHGELPAKLEALASDVTHGVGATPDGTPLTCPLCGKPYVYDPRGVRLANWSGWMILYDPQPCHGGMRLALLAEALEPAKPLVVRVLAVSENSIRWPAASTNGDAAPASSEPAEETRVGE
jgi:hypothetical protein